MKLKTIILPLITGACLASCSAVYEDLDPCPQGANVTLTFYNNVSNTDRFASDVHCAKLLVYNDKGNFVGEYEYNSTNTISVELRAGNYHAIAYGGMSCDLADFDFANSLNDPHHYTDVVTYLLGTRSESAKNLHPHFHGSGDFTITDDALSFVNTTIDLTKNTNDIHVVLKYSDGSPIDARDFDISISADNAATDHANAILPSGAPVTYRPHTYDATRAVSLSGNSDATRADANTSSASLSLAKLEPSLAARLTVVSNATGEKPVDIDLIDHLDKIRELDMPGASLRDYLERQDSWTLEFTLDPATDLIFGLTIKINSWTIVLNRFEL